MLSRTCTHVSLRLIQALVLSDNCIGEHIRPSVHEGVIGKEATTTEHFTIVILAIKRTQEARDFVLSHFNNEVRHFENGAGSAFEILDFFHEGVACMKDFLRNCVVSLMQEDSALFLGFLASDCLNYLLRLCLFLLLCRN